MLGISA